MATLAVLAAVLTLIPYMTENKDEKQTRLVVVATTLATVADLETEDPPTTTTTTRPHPVADFTELLETLPAPTWPQIACAAIAQYPADKFLDRVQHLCPTTAQALLDLIEGRHGIATQLDRLPPKPGDEDFVSEFFTQDVAHMLYVNSFESGGDPLANGRNWGCPRQEAIAAFHPDPDGVGPDGRANCPYLQNKVPIGDVSHMAHTLEGRSDRILGWLIDPYDLYESSLLGFGLVFETGGNGWYHWWHIHWGLNAYIVPLGIQGVYYCPPGPYWQNVKGGWQPCPYE